MRKIILLFTICLTWGTFIYCQNNTSSISNSGEHLYLIMSTSNDLHTHKIKPPHTRAENYRDTGFISLLLSVRADSLFIVDTLNYDPDRNTYVKFISRSINGNWLSMVEEDIFNMDDISTYCVNNYLSAIDYSKDTIAIRQMKIHCDHPERIGGTYPFFSYFLDNEYYIPVGIIPTTSLRYVMNRHLNIRRVNEDQFFSDWVVNLESGFQIRGYIFNFKFSIGGYLYFFMERNKLATRALHKKTEECRETELDFPFRPESYSGIKGVNILYNEVRSRYKIASFAYTPLEPLSFDQRLYFIKDKANEVWDSISLPINNNFSVYEDEWVYGTLIRHCPDCQYNSALDSFNVYMEKYPDKYSQKYGYYPNLTLASGKLFLFHIPTKQYFEFDTGERDSEFLAIHNNKIYYRQYDKIRMMDLNIENEGFHQSTITTIVRENDMIPNVHHVFWSHATEVIREYVDFKD